ncbi:MarR family transcriptional regulator [Streptomyces sp. NPDC049954]|uniref:MarR family transcriptional regulator n=1 Tax=Streptomyces sp. NPDC049954 TaxID=3155779 RepID=UPI0034325265
MSSHQTPGPADSRGRDGADCPRGPDGAPAHGGAPSGPRSVARALVALAERGATAGEPLVSPAAARALATLDSAGPLSIGNLARRLRAPVASVSRLCGRLVRGGLLERSRPGDRRRVVVSLTPRGAAVLRSHRARRTRRLAQDLPGPREAAGLLAALRRLRDRLREEDERGRSEG